MYGELLVRHSTYIQNPTIPAQALSYRFEGSEQRKAVHSQHKAPPVVSIMILILSL